MLTISHSLGPKLALRGATDYPLMLFLLLLQLQKPENPPERKEKNEQLSPNIKYRNWKTNFKGIII